MATVRLTDVKKSFGALEIIKGVNLQIADKEFVVIVGPSGCGKSTLLRMIAGLEDIDGGAVEIDGEIVNELPPAKRKIAMVFQSYALYPHKTVRENIGFALRMAKMDKKSIELKVQEAARILELEALLNRRPKELSGGQRQRVAIGRAIVRNPRLFLLDEPLSNLDAALRGQMRVEIAKLHQTLNATIIYVTHDQVEAMTLADKIVVLKDGNIEQVGSPIELYDRPHNLFVAGFIGSPKMNFLRGKVIAVDQDSVRIEIVGCKAFDYPVLKAKTIMIGAHITLGVRPEHFSTSEGNFELQLWADVVERLGAVSHVLSKTEFGENVVVSLEGYTEIRPGDQFSLLVSIAQMHLFDAQGLAIETPIRSTVIVNSNKPQLKRKN